MNIDIIRNHTVKVQNGSGVILKPLSNEYLYIFTAFHVIEGLENKEISIEFDISSINYRQGINIHNIYSQEDVAIIVIDNNLREIEYIRPNTNIQNAKNIFHIGYPECRNHVGAVSSLMSLPITEIVGTIKKNYLIEYQYGIAPERDQIKGMSGGGIIDDNLQIFGLHKQSSNIDSKELLGMADFLCISCYTDLIKKHKLSPVVCFDLSDFVAFVDCVFDMSNKQIDKWLCNLNNALMFEKLNVKKACPEKIFSVLMTKGKLSKEISIDEISFKRWVAFAEYLIGMQVLLTKEFNNDDILDLFDNFHYIYLENEIDLLEVREKLDMNLIKGINQKAKLIIGGLDKHSSYIADVIPPVTKVPPNIGRKIDFDNGTFDILKGDRGLLEWITIINNSLFRDAMKHNAKELSLEDPETVQEKYKELILNKIEENEL